MADLALTKLPLLEISGRIKRRDVSAVEVVEASLAAIERHNDTLNAFRLVLAEESLAAARATDAEIAADNYRGPLHGVPVAVKDLMDLAGTSTPAGSKVFANEVIQEDSEVVRRFKAAGAIVVGKTHMPEFAYAPSSHNEHYGPVRNPWNVEFDTGGSSSGTGAAVAAGLVYGATGSDTGGSIRIPSALCGLAGMKATFGRVSARGAAPLSWSLDHVGPMTRTVADAAIMLQAMAGYDPGDGRTRQIPVDDYPGSVSEGVAGLRVGLITSDERPGNFCTAAVETGLRAAGAALESDGAIVSEISMPLLHDLAMVTTGILNLEATATYEDVLRDQPAVIGRWTRLRLLTSFAYGPTDYIKIQHLRRIYRERAERFMADYDLLLLPSVPHEAPALAEVIQNNRFTSPFNGLGWPAMSLPAGLGKADLPVGAQLVALPWSEDLVLCAAGVVEREGAWNGRLSPLLAAG